MTADLLTRRDAETGAPAVERTGHRRALALFGLLGSTVLAACVQLTAPDRPIEINLNITIKQEVLVRLAPEARDLIERNEGVF